MNKAWDKLVKRKSFPAIGFFKSVEVTRNNDPTSEWYGTAHPHFHVLMMVNSSYFRYGYLNQKDWAQMWQSCLQVEYEPMVNVKIVKPKGEAKTLDAESLMHAVKEVLKYTVKEEELVIDQAWIVELAKQLHKTRAVSVGGVLKNYLSEEDVTEEEMLSGDDEPDDDSQTTNEHWLFGWREDYKRYLKLQNAS
jgi:hypothetical protein